MSREIKFRGLIEDIEENEWIYGYYFEDGDKESNIQELVTEEIAAVKYETVGQYTGLKDRNSKEIYEGDIVKTHEGHLMTVIWQDNGFKLMFKFKRTYQGESYTETRKDISLNGSNDKRWGCKVIGNIYEDPNLLKEN